MAWLVSAEPNPKHNEVTRSCVCNRTVNIPYPNDFYTKIFKIIRKELREKQSFDSLGVIFFYQSLT